MTTKTQATMLAVWWWQSTEANAVRWVVPQWEVLAADRGGWRAGPKGLRVGGSEVGVW
jgi:hypothetical protein